MSNLSPAIKRLHQDLKELKENPIVGANAEPYGDSDLTTWYGLVIGTEDSLLSGIPIRFCLEFPNEYPNVPPKAYFETYISYQNGAQYKDSKGRIEVCLNIFGNFGHIHTEWGSSSEGWSPSYTVSTILVSVQAMMMGDMLSSRLEEVKKMTDAAINLNCNITGHQGSDSRKWFPQVITDPAVAKQISDKYKKPIPNIVETFYICYANSQQNGNSRLGYGIHVENPRSGMLTSPCEYLSLDSFSKGNVRRSSTNQPFEHWLPILIKNEDWNTRLNIKKGFIIYVNQICDAIGFKGDVDSRVFKVCSSLMNGLVVQIMNNKDNPTANDKFINGYFAIYRLLTTYAKDYPNLVGTADANLKRFITNPSFRVKQQVPNLGEFLIYLTISKAFTWSDISQSFMEENDTRNVFWYVKGNRNNPPSHPELSKPCADSVRCEKVFKVTTVSRNLILFQTKFANVATVLRISGLMDEESNYGLAPESLRAELKELYKIVIAIENWDKYFQLMEMPAKTQSQRATELVNAIKRSMNQGYH